MRTSSVCPHMFRFRICACQPYENVPCTLFDLTCSSAHMHAHRPTCRHPGDAVRTFGARRRSPVCGERAEPDAPVRHVHAHPPAEKRACTSVAMRVHTATGVHAHGPVCMQTGCRVHARRRCGSHIGGVHAHWSRKHRCALTRQPACMHASNNSTDCKTPLDWMTHSPRLRSLLWRAARTREEELNRASAHDGGEPLPHGAFIIGLGRTNAGLAT
jgi:hypothetical protein